MNMNKKAELKTWVWALVDSYDNRNRFLGRFAWPSGDGLPDFYPRIFRTRSQVREAKRTCYLHDARVVKVKMDIEEV